MRMARRAGLISGKGTFYLFRDGLVNGIQWSGSNGNYSSYLIGTTIECTAQVNPGEIAGSGNALVALTIDLSKYTTLHFWVPALSRYSSTAPNIRVNGEYASVGAGEVTFDLTGLADRSSVTILIQSGRVSKSTSSGVVKSSITVSSVWATQDS